LLWLLIPHVENKTKITNARRFREEQEEGAMGSEVFDWSHNKDQWLAAVTKRCNKEPATGTKSYGK
jgi:hypothetical protein